MRHYFFYKKILFVFFINFYIINFCSVSTNKAFAARSCKEYDLKNSSCINNYNLENKIFDDLETKTLLLPISSSQNLYTQYHKPKYQKFDISCTYRFQESYNNSDIFRSVCDRNPLLFVGFIGDTIDDTGRPKNALLPEYFGLSPDTNISCYFSPQITNQIVDVQFSLQGNHFWTQVNLPLVKAQWRITTLPISNNEFVGKTPLQPYAETYIYNIAQTVNDSPNTLPPAGSAAQSQAYNYNILPIITPPAPITPPNYIGAYIVSSVDASEGDTFIRASYFTPKDENLGSIDFTNSFYNEGFIGNSELNENNWKLDIGEWPDVNYESLMYEAATVSSQNPNDTNPATLNLVGQYTLTGDAQQVASNNGSVNTIQIKQNQLNQANNLVDALSGEYNFNQSLTRLYNNFNLNQDYSTQIWGIGDIIVWLGYDFCRDKKKNIGCYVHGVIPAGTNITDQWYRYTLNPVVGNGNHYQLGIGLSSRYLFCSRNTFTLECNINGYIDHVFAAKQFRVFDKLKNPMSRYALVKKLIYTGAASDNVFNDNYEYLNLDFLGNVNNANLMVSNNFKGELIVDFVMKNNCFEVGLGYAFSGISADIINSNVVPAYNNNNLPTINQIYYGYKGNTAISNLILMNITSGQEVFDPSANANPQFLGLCPNNPPLPAPQIACNYPLAGAFPQPTVVGVITPSGNDILIKSCGDVTKKGNSGAYLYGESSGGNNNGSDYVGTTIDDVFILPNIINNNSGLMNAQILNRIFTHIEYNWESLYSPTIGLLGSYGFGSEKYFTPLYWDVGFYIGCSF